MLRCVATCWIWNRSNFSCNILDVAWCCTRLATFTQHCCARACALGPLAIATRQRHDGFLSVTMADNTAQIQKPKKKCPRRWTEGETTSLIDLLEERPCLIWKVVPFKGDKGTGVWRMFEKWKSCNSTTISIPLKSSILIFVYVRMRQRPGAHKQRHVAMNTQTSYNKQALPESAISISWIPQHGNRPATREKRHIAQYEPATCHF